MGSQRGRLRLGVQGMRCGSVRGESGPGCRKAVGMEGPVDNWKMLSRICGRQNDPRCEGTELQRRRRVVSPEGGESE